MTARNAGTSWDWNARGSIAADIGCPGSPSIPRRWAMAGCEPSNFSPTSERSVTRSFVRATGGASVPVSWKTARKIWTIGA
jgi:hypothetical protein